MLPKVTLVRIVWCASNCGVSIIIPMLTFMLLMSWRSHCETALSYLSAPGGRLLTDQANPLGLFTCLWYCPHPPSLFAMAALRSRCGHYIFVLFLLLLTFFPRLISAVADWMSTLLRHMMWPWCKFRMHVWNVLRVACWKCRTQKFAIWAPSHNFVGLYLRNWGTYRQSVKKHVKQQYLLHMLPQYGELWPSSSWDLSGSLGHPYKFQRVSCLGIITARHSSSGRQPNFAVLNRGCYLYSAGRPSRWTLAHISSYYYYYSP